MVATISPTPHTLLNMTLLLTHQETNYNPLPLEPGLALGTFLEPKECSRSEAVWSRRGQKKPCSSCLGLWEHSLTGGSRWGTTLWNPGAVLWEVQAILERSRAGVWLFQLSQPGSGTRHVNEVPSLNWTQQPSPWEPPVWVIPVEPQMPWSQEVPSLLCFFQTPEAQKPQLSSNGCWFMPLSCGMACYTAIDNQNIEDV